MASARTRRGRDRDRDDGDRDGAADGRGGRTTDGGRRRSPVVETALGVIKVIIQSAGLDTSRGLPGDHIVVYFSDLFGNSPTLLAIGTQLAQGVAARFLPAGAARELVEVGLDALFDRMVRLPADLDRDPEQMRASFTDISAYVRQKMDERRATLSSPQVSYADAFRRLTPEKQEQLTLWIAALPRVDETFVNRWQNAAPRLTDPKLLETLLGMHSTPEDAEAFLLPRGARALTIDQRLRYQLVSKQIAYAETAAFGAATSATNVQAIRDEVVAALRSIARGQRNATTAAVEARIRELTATTQDFARAHRRAANLRSRLYR